ncbi:MAG: hypothetical protein KAW13_01335 [Dehalococcoidia bacterium]|nr:hypothetical protein [Dehalococcoidia bacterium]
MDDWQTIANIAILLAVIITIGVFIWEVIASRRERTFSVFLRLLDYYEKIMSERRRKWKTIKETVKDNAKIAEEIGDKTSTLDYLLTRAKQEEPLYAIEHELLEHEIRSLSLLNELCKYASKDEQKALVLRVSYSSEISYYQNRLKDILLILDKEKQLRLFSIPQYGHLQKFSIGGYFG